MWFLSYSVMTFSYINSCTILVSPISTSGGPAGHMTPECLLTQTCLPKLSILEDGWGGQHSPWESLEWNSRMARVVLDQWQSLSFWWKGMNAQTFRALWTIILSDNDGQLIIHLWRLKSILIPPFNPLKTSPEYTRAGVYGKCVL